MGLGHSLSQKESNLLHFFDQMFANDMIFNDYRKSISKFVAPLCRATIFFSTESVHISQPFDCLLTICIIIMFIGYSCHICSAVSVEYLEVLDKIHL